MKKNHRNVFYIMLMKYNAKSSIKYSKRSNLLEKKSLLLPQAGHASLHYYPNIITFGSFS